MEFDCVKGREYWKSMAKEEKAFLWVGEFIARLVLLRINRRAMAIMGVQGILEARELFSSLFQVETFPSLEKLLIDILKGETGVAKEVKILTPAGRIRYWQLSGISIPAGREGGERMVISLVDVTERWLAQEERERPYFRLCGVFDQVVEMTSALVETRCPYTAGYQRRVAQLAHALGQEMGMDGGALWNLFIAGMLHDIGKMGIPAETLNKTAKLSWIEWELMKTHPQLGYEVLEKIDFPSQVKVAVLEHHERIDGSGYPRDISEDEISLEGKILAVADVVEAMSSHRPYRPAPGIVEALKEIENYKGILYEAQIVTLCVALFQTKGFVFRD